MPRTSIGLDLIHYRSGRLLTVKLSNAIGYTKCFPILTRHPGPPRTSISTACASWWSKNPQTPQVYSTDGLEDSHTFSGSGRIEGAGLGGV